MKKCHWFAEAVLLLFLTAVATAATFWLHPNRPALYLNEEATPQGEISVAEAKAADAIWIDARVRKSFEAGHVPNALLVSENETDYQDLLFAAATLINEQQEKLVIVYCDAKKCEASHHVAETIRGFHPDPDKVKVLHGGWDAWSKGH